jgi:uncharacterized protein YjiS (DUF1127 family)
MLARTAHRNVVLLPFSGERRNSRLFGRVGRTLGEALRAFGEARRRRAALNELHHLTERQLADIGLTRGDVQRVCAARAARQKARRLAPGWPA